MALLQQIISFLKRPEIVGLLLGIAYGFLVLVVISFEEAFVENVSLAFVLITPAVMGYITVLSGSDEQRQNWSFAIFMPWLTILGFAIAAILTQIEALICIVMLLPAFLFSASLGGVIVKLTNESQANAKTSSLLLLLPFVIGPVEKQITNKVTQDQVSTAIKINADRKAVWQHIKSVDSIDESELVWSFAHFVGVPDPVSSKLTKADTGGVRKIHWKAGIKFKEIIREWEPYDHFKYRVQVDTIPPNAIDPHIEVGDEHFRVKSGGYRLQKLAKNQTRLTLYCNYEVATKFNFYSKFWADLFLDDFQQVILHVIKNRCES